MRSGLAGPGSGFSPNPATGVCPIRLSQAGGVNLEPGVGPLSCEKRSVFAPSDGESNDPVSIADLSSYRAAVPVV
jgi:hypothetical protein